MVHLLKIIKLNLLMQTTVDAGIKQVDEVNIQKRKFGLIYKKNSEFKTSVDFI